MTALQPAGHTRAIANKAYAAAPTSDLENAFLEWMRTPYGGYDDAIELLDGKPFSADDLHFLVLRHRDIRPVDSGTFVSAGYTTCPERVIRYDLDIPLVALGDELPADKLLINTGTTGDSFGESSFGTILNCGTTGDDMGRFAEGIVINAGTAGTRFGASWRGSISLALHEPMEYRHSRATLLQADNIQNGLRQYLETLTETCKGPIGQIYHTYGPIPATTIRQDIEKILAGVHT